MAIDTEDKATIHIFNKRGRGRPKTRVESAKELAKNHHTNTQINILKDLTDLIIKVKLELQQKHNSVSQLVILNHKNMKVIIIIQMISLELLSKKLPSVIMLLVA